MATSSACFFGILRTQIGASVQFSRIVRCGNRLKCWNTMPTSRRTSSIFFRSLVSSMPSTMILPFWCSSSRLMQRIMVDLPEPEGPAMTMRSPRITFRLMSRSTWNSPYHLFMSTISMATSVSEIANFWMRLRLPCGFPSYRLWPVSSRRSTKAGIARHAEAENPEDEAGKDQSGHRRDRCRSSWHRQSWRLTMPEQVEHADDREPATCP